MTGHRITLVIDPDMLAAASGAPPTTLFPAGGAWRRALARLHAGGVHPPVELALHLYAYEVLERLRDVALTASDPAVVVAPFWPPAALTAAGIAGHAGDDLAALHPPLEAIQFSAVAAAEIDGAQRAVFGAVAFDAERYLHAVHGSTPLGAPERVTAAGLIARGRDMLLEQRRSTARSHPGVWDSPGGHVEAGETPDAALVRELAEELGIAVGGFRLVAVQHDASPEAGALYLHHVFLIDAFTGGSSSGEPVAREGQTLAWHDLAAVARGSSPSPLNPLLVAAVRAGLARGWLNPSA